MKKFFSFILTFLITFSVFSQASVEIADPFYLKALGWELKGLTSTLPQLRPYPMSVIKRVLNDVIENGGEEDAQIAREEYQRIFSKAWTPYFHGTVDGKITNEKHSSQSKTSTLKDFHGEIGLGGDLDLIKYVSIGYKFGIYGQTKDFSDYSPLYKNMLEDSIFDPVDAGPLTAYLNWNINTSVGTDKLYGSIGMSRVGFGPFYGDGLALNDYGYHSANIVFNITRDKWSYASVYENIGATRNMGPSINSNWLDRGKYLAFHSLKWHAFKKIHVTYYENIIWGPYNNLSYFAPAPYYAVQNIGGANDNLQMALLFEYMPFSGFKWATDFFADDISLDDVLRLNFDSKLRFGFQSGVIYYPEFKHVDRLSLYYTAVMPYVYTHWDFDNTDGGYFTGKTWNRQNYTNAGVNIGSSLDPNSDKIALSAQFSPNKNLSLTLAGNFIRHANSAEDFSDDEAAEYMLAKKNIYTTDGSVYMHQMFVSDSANGKHVNSAWEKLGFMTSDHKMYVSQLSLDAEYTFARTKYGRFSLCAGYTFEYIKNAGVNKSIYNGGLLDGDKIVDNGDGTYIADGEYYSSWEELKKSPYVLNAVEKARNEWVDALYDKMNHYFSISLKYSY